MSSPGNEQNHPTHSSVGLLPQSPSHRHRTSQTSYIPPETPRKRRDNHQQRLQGVKSNLPAHLSLVSIWQRLINSFTLSYTPDDWQVHLIRRILQGYDSIFCAGTGYGKSLMVVLESWYSLLVHSRPLNVIRQNKPLKRVSTLL